MLVGCWVAYVLLGRLDKLPGVGVCCACSSKPYLQDKGSEAKVQPMIVDEETGTIVAHNSAATTQTWAPATPMYMTAMTHAASAAPGSPAQSAMGATITSTMTTPHQEQYPVVASASASPTKSAAA